MYSNKYHQRGYRYTVFHWFSKDGCLWAQHFKVLSFSHFCKYHVYRDQDSWLKLNKMYNVPMAVYGCKIPYVYVGVQSFYLIF